MMSLPAFAETSPEPDSTSAAGAVQDKDTITTGVAKGRDRLDSATSTSVLRPADIERFGPRSVADLLRDAPGIRSEASTDDGQNSLSIRGLPIATTGAKFVQLQEDGLPILEFGDLLGKSADSYLRLDMNLAQVEVIRGGSASTFASNSPGGIINFQSKTGEVEGGAIAVTAGLDYKSYRSDFDYGARLSENLRFHVGGFYRQGEGPRRAGYDAQKGGQIKVNVTRDFAGGYIRFYGKYLDDRTPHYDAVPFLATGTDADPSFGALPGFDGRRDTSLSRNIRSNLVLDQNNNPVRHDVADGQRAKAATFGVETRIDLAGWTITERFRYASQSGTLIAPYTSVFAPATAASQLLGGPGARLSYANGPLAGQAIADPQGLNGNGLLTLINMLDLRVNDLNNFTNDIRGSRVWDVGGGDLTGTAGFYAARQTVDESVLWTTQVSDVRGDGRAALIDVTTAAGVPVTQDGYYAYNLALVGGGRRFHVAVDYAVNAPFASLNYHIGRVAIGGSIRYDYGSAQGQVAGANLTGGVNTVTRDINGDGVITAPETRVGVLPQTRAALVDYTYNYLSYSTGINFRISEPLAVFARYSRGARAPGDRLLVGGGVNANTGKLVQERAAYDPVKQAEIGVKYRTEQVTLNLTGFWAKTQDTNTDPVISALISRDYKAYGLEFEGGVRRGIFQLNGGATYTHAEIDKDQVTPALEGNTPRHQAKFIFQATPQVITGRFSVGAVFVGTTGSFAQDSNLLRMPGYVTTNGFVQVRPADRLTLSLNASNLFDTRAFVAIDDATLPASGIVRGRVLNGRTVSATARFDF
ncbi:outer membrane receptor protein involved in Fe transport [Sphingomonas sp. BE138]|uniref:TonB-dependent receptor domain-containing protein n=1 Tax=Sphingomonas sp. BE138 TaxID=2817845 RepID=UPI0028643631|nr:TonB-dependent receptor [Sphingomonas sp. BE138]MDR6786819.1 outer membrane receptor protein involved in Fe transport [Sphingomonas sp. BE138]